MRKHLEMGLDAPIRHLPYFLPKRIDADSALPPAASARPYFLFVGRLEYIKGVQNLINAFRDNPEFDLLIAGDGVYRRALELQADGCSNIKFLGRQDQGSLSGLYRSAMAVIVPSICYETFGIIIIEAFSYKTPVIVNDLGALPEVVEDSGGGFVYQNEEGLVEAMRKIAADPERRAELGENGYRAYLKYWSEEPHIDMYLDLIRKIAESRGRDLVSGINVERAARSN